MEAVFTECVLEAKARGRTVLLSSHILSEVEKLCDTVTIIRRGRAVESGTLDELRHLTRSAVRATVTGDAGALEGADGVHNLRIDGDTVAFDVDNSRMDAVMATLTGLGIRSLVSNPPSLEELFMRHYGDELAALNGNGGTAG
jgi:ABC-2 type transport system ATP-binding protein